MWTDSTGPADRPLVSFVLFTFNQEPYVRLAVAAALAQTYEPLEIIISDDASSDRTAAVIAEALDGYAGPHQVSFLRNPCNLGLIGHVNKLCNLARGDLIVVAAGDDISHPERVQRQVEAFLQEPGRVHSVHSAVMKIDLQGRPLGLWTPPILQTDNSPEQLMFRLNGVIGATHAWSRAAWQHFGPIRVAGTYEDLVMVFRAALLGGVRYIDAPLVDYRWGSGISTSAPAINPRGAPWADALKQNRLWMGTARQRAIDCVAVRRHGLALRLGFAWFKASFKLAYFKLRLWAQDAAGRAGRVHPDHH